MESGRLERKADFLDLGLVLQHPKYEWIKEGQTRFGAGKAEATDQRKRLRNEELPRRQACRPGASSIRWLFEATEFDNRQEDHQANGEDGAESIHNRKEVNGERPECKHITVCRRTPIVIDEELSHELKHPGHEVAQGTVAFIWAK